MTVKAAITFAAGHGASATLVSAKVISLTEEVVKTMFLMKLKVMATVGLLVGVVFAGAAVYTGVLKADTSGAQRMADSAPVAEVPQKERRDDPKKRSEDLQAKDPKIRSLLNERAVILRKRLNVMTKTYKERRWTPKPIEFESIQKAFAQSLNADLELCESDLERLRVKLASAREYERVTDEMRKEQFIHEDVFLAGVAKRLEIEIAYEREKAKATTK